MDYEYIIKDGVLTDVIDLVIGESIGRNIYIDEIIVPEGVESLGTCLFTCMVGSIIRLYLPKSLKLIDNYAFSRRTIDKLFYDGTLVEFARIKTRISPQYKIHMAYCNDGVIDFSNEFFIEKMTFEGTIEDCKKSAESNWLYRRTRQVHCLDDIWAKNTNNTIEEYMKIDGEDEPEWLMTYIPGTKPDFLKVFSSKNVYYPGAGMDTQPIETFRKNGASHLFIYADYGSQIFAIEERLQSELFMYGYDCIGIERLNEKDIAPEGWSHHIRMESIQRRAFINTRGFGLFAVYERKPTYKIEGEPERFALLYLGSDGIATYDALYGNGYVDPNILILQDHGFGGNYDQFGAGGLMETIASKTGKWPKYIECDENTKIWNGYTQIKNVEGVHGGMHHSKRYLWKR